MRKVLAAVAALGIVGTGLAASPAPQAEASEFKCSLLRKVEGRYGRAGYLYWCTNYQVFAVMTGAQNIGDGADRIEVLYNGRTLLEKESPRGRNLTISTYSTTWKNRYPSNFRVCVYVGNRPNATSCA